MSRVALYFKKLPEADRWVVGDRFWRPLVRRIIRGKPRPSGVDKVAINLALGLARLGVEVRMNPVAGVPNGQRVGLLGQGTHCLAGFGQDHPIVAGPAVVTHPSEWPTLCLEYPVVHYLQPSTWANEVFKPFYGDRCAIWPVGIDTDTWAQVPSTGKTTDFLVYDKIMWDYEKTSAGLKAPILSQLSERGFTFETIRYGGYQPQEFRRALGRCRAMIFLCEHESQGIAYQECLSSGVPILAWDQGWYLDPMRFDWGCPEAPATSVPYFDERCGLTFRNLGEFPTRLEEFVGTLKAEKFAPRDYICENLTLEKSARRYLELLQG